jgi:hypothetical protein
LLTLLRAASQGREDVPLATFDAAAIRWALETGLGPLLFHTTQGDPQATTSPLWPLVHGADLTAQVLTGAQVEAMEDILDACAGRVPPLTLLKGISMGEQYYPQPHLRPMRDLDVLVDGAAVPCVATLLRQLGYCQRSRNSPAFFNTLHHSMPFWHPHRRVWVEIHRGLFPPDSRVHAAQVFRPAHLVTQRQPSTFRGRPVYRLSAELQLVYLAAHWGYDPPLVGGMIAMVDLLYLLQRTSPGLHWETISAGVHGTVAATHLYLLLSYLHSYHLLGVAPAILQRLMDAQATVSPMQLRMLHTLIDRYLVDGHARGPVFRLRALRRLGPALFRIPWNALLLPGSLSRNLLHVIRLCLQRSHRNPW